MDLKKTFVEFQFGENTDGVYKNERYIIETCYTKSSTRNKIYENHS